MQILVTGGAGYIGSHMAKLLAKNDYDVVILDNLTTGHASLAKYGKLITGDLSDKNKLLKIFTENKFDCVIHFAGSSLVSESIKNPSKYYNNNLCNTLNLLDVMLKNNVKNFIFSSTAATFGNPIYTPIDEKHLQNPINPYGASKLMIEKILEDYSNAYKLNSVSLRYFNAAGADLDNELGEMHDPETHLIPLVLQAASGRRSHVNIFGQDYDTDDGTCIRDYIHVEDLCQAHLLAMDSILSKKIKGTEYFNLGNGKGFSVLQVIKAAKKIVSQDGYDFLVNFSERRSGDPSVLIANSDRAKKHLNWNPKHSSIENIIMHAWEWEKLFFNKNHDH